MPKNLKTEWKRIGRSGATVDGRHIEPEWLTEAAENYNKDQYTALMWPEHERWANLGTVEALRAEANDEGGVDMFALIAPNDIYLAANRAGQKLFTSMELMPNFRDTGIHYLTGCAATDNPASAATSEIRFSKSQADPKTLLLAQHVEATTHDFDDTDPGESLARRLLSLLSKSSEDDMKKDQIDELKTQVNALALQFKQAFPGEQKPDDKTTKTDKNDSDDRYSALETQITELRSELDQVKKQGGDETAADGVSLETFNQLKASFDALQKSFTEAVKEQPGTDGGDHVSDGENLQDYI